MSKMQVKVKSLQDAVLAAWDTGHLLSSDMSALCKHLTKMKWEIYTLEKGALIACQMHVLLSMREGCFVLHV